MLKILLPVDGSECSTRATRKLIENLPAYRKRPTIDLLAVHLPVPKVPRMNLVVSKEALADYYNSELEAMLLGSTATKVVHAARIPVVLVH